MIIVTRSICFGTGNTVREAIRNWLDNYTQEYPEPDQDIIKEFFKTPSRHFMVYKVKY